jgi:Flp pilus assembly protein TadD
MRARSLLFTGIVLLVELASMPATAEVRITIPKRSKATPVQKLNQDGVKAVEKQHYDKAKSLFYKAYLLDPNDPFTLNNLGYIAEIEGQLERAQRFYALAAEQKSEATIATASSESLKGKTVAEVAGRTDDLQLQVNQLNLEAISLLLKDRAPEADVLLMKALKLDSSNPFTLNNMGFAKEKEGELEQALDFYMKSASLRSEEPVVVAVDKDTRGEPISKAAENNASKLRRVMRNEQSAEARIARLNLRGVSAINRNEPKAARQYFEQAYKLDPRNAFTLNNMGYLAEMEGDRETADFYYAQAQEAQGGNARVDVSTRAGAEGKPLRNMAEVSGQQVQLRIEAERQARTLQGGPVLLRNRNGSVVVEPERPAAPAQQPGPERLPSLDQPSATPAPPGGLLMPLPDDEQPEVQSNPPQEAQPAPEQNK